MTLIQLIAYAWALQLQLLLKLLLIYYACDFSVELVRSVNFPSEGRIYEVARNAMILALIGMTIPALKAIVP